MKERENKMKLKRYVMIKNNGVYIYKLNNIDKFKTYIEDDKVQLCLGDKRSYWGELIKSSDNILDLIEVEDLVAHRFYGQEDSIITHIKNDNDIRFHVEKKVIKSGDITAIYKLQPNGDYKKYEVEK
jgi:hypothetical protein